MKGAHEKPNGTPLNSGNRRRFLGLWPRHSLGGAAQMTFNVISVAETLTRPVRTIEARDRHEALSSRSACIPTQQ